MLNSYHDRRISVAFAIGFLATSFPIDTRGGESGLVERIVAAWEERQARIESAAFSWETTRTEPKGGLTDAMRFNDPKAPPFPPSDATYSSRDSIWLHKERVRHEQEAPRRVMPLGGDLVNMTQVCIFDGDRTQQYEVAENDRLNKQGYVNSSHRAMPILSGLVSEPLMIYVRPFDSHIGRLTKDSVRLVKEGETINGRTVVVLDAHTSLRRRLWVDVERDFAIVRSVRELPSGRVAGQVDVEFAKHPVYGWIPDKWRTASFNRDGSPRLFHSCRVTSLRINKPVPDEVFTISFPPGTRVVDEKAAEYVANADGELQAVAPASAQRSAPMSDSSVFFLLNIAIIIALLGSLLWIRRRSRSAS